MSCNREKWVKREDVSTLKITPVNPSWNWQILELGKQILLFFTPGPMWTRTIICSWTRCQPVLVVGSIINVGLSRRKNGGEFTFFMRHLYATLRDKSIKCVLLIKSWNSWVTKGVGETLIWFLNLLFPTHWSLLIMELKYISFNCENATKRIVKQKPQLSHQNHPLSIELLNTRHNASANRVIMKRIDNKIENFPSYAGGEIETVCEL